MDQEVEAKVKGGVEREVLLTMITRENMSMKEEDIAATAKT